MTCKRTTRISDFDNQTAHNSLKQTNKRDGTRQLYETTEKSDQQSNDKQGTAEKGSRARGKAEQETTRRRNEKRYQEKNSGETARQGRQDNKRIQADKITRQTR